jgi:hypothetical protein
MVSISYSFHEIACKCKVYKSKLVVYQFNQSAIASDETSNNSWIDSIA